MTVCIPHIKGKPPEAFSAVCWVLSSISLTDSLSPVQNPCFSYTLSLTSHFFKRSALPPPVSATSETLRKHSKCPPQNVDTHIPRWLFHYHASADIWRNITTPLGIQQHIYHTISKARISHGLSLCEIFSLHLPCASWKAQRMILIIEKCYSKLFIFNTKTLQPPNSLTVLRQRFSMCGSRFFFFFIALFNFHEDLNL